jgi:putative tricarboxylic transport membrane protein
MFAAGAHAEFKPNKPVEFIVTAGPGGGTDQFARTVQAIITKYKLMDQPVVVLNKGGGSGAEGFVAGKSPPNEANRLIFATSNEWMLPMVAKLAFKHGDLKPVAAMALDEFLLWVKADAPYKDAKSYVEAAKAKPGELKMGGSQSKDVDQLLTRLIEKATGAKFTYVPFKSGNEAAVQLAGGHIDSNVNNPSENIGQWKANAVRPLCVFSPQRMPGGPKVTETMAWSDIPTCQETGLPIAQYQMPRTIFVPNGVPDDAVAFYVGILRQVREKPEWQDYIQRTSQTDRFLDDKDLAKFIADDEAKARAIFKEEGWLVN